MLRVLWVWGVIFSLSMSKIALAADNIAAPTSILARFQPVFTHAAAVGKAEKHVYVDNLTAFDAIVDYRFSPHWDATMLVRRLIGPQTFQSLNEMDRRVLVEEMERTLRRYAFENRKRYAKGRFTLIGAEFNQSSGQSLLKVLMEVPYFPDIVLTVYLAQDGDDGWKAFDLGFKGISYVDIKEKPFRRLLTKKGVKGLVAKLQEKNDRYFRALCDEMGVPGQEPC